MVENEEGYGWLSLSFWPREASCGNWNVFVFLRCALIAVFSVFLLYDHIMILGFLILCLYGRMYGMYSQGCSRFCDMVLKIISTNPISWENVTYFWGIIIFVWICTMKLKVPSSSVQRSINMYDLIHTEMYNFKKKVSKKVHRIQRTMNLFNVHVDDSYRNMIFRKKISWISMNSYELDFYRNWFFRKK